MSTSKIPADSLHIEPTPLGWMAYYDPEGFTGHGKTQQDAITDLLEQTDEAYSVMWAERQRLRKELADMRDNGLRFDLNPALDHHPERVAFSYLAYIRRIDESIRERAKRVLEDAPSGIHRQDNVAGVAIAPRNAALVADKLADSGTAPEASPSSAQASGDTNYPTEDLHCGCGEYGACPAPAPPCCWIHGGAHVPPEWAAENGVPDRHLNDKEKT